MSIKQEYYSTYKTFVELCKIHFNREDFINIIWLKCCDCNEEVEVKCDYDNAMYCPECLSVDNFEEIQDELCSTCNGSGEGHYSDSICSDCKGKGIQ